jgi:hypothetical protein
MNNTMNTMNTSPSPPPSVMSIMSVKPIYSPFVNLSPCQPRSPINSTGGAVLGDDGRCARMCYSEKVLPNEGAEL